MACGLSDCEDALRDSIGLQAEDRRKLEEAGVAATFEPATLYATGRSPVGLNYACSCVQWARTCTFLHSRAPV